MFLKYAGLFIATASSIWGLISKTTIEVEGGKKLTRDGYIAIGITLTGLLISLGSNIISDRQQEEAREKAVQEEVQRTKKILLSSQPLTSLDLQWEFHQLPSSLVEAMQVADQEVTEKLWDSQGGTTGEEGNEITRYQMLYPFMVQLADTLDQTKEDASESDEHGVLALVALDENANLVLPFGRVSSAATWDLQEGAKLAQAGNTFAGGVALCQDRYAGCSSDDPLQHASRAATSWPSLYFRADPASQGTEMLVIRWFIDPSTLANAIDRQNAQVIPTAFMPDRVRVALLFDIEDLPFKTSNLASPTVYSLWAEADYGNTSIDLAKAGIASTLRLIPNGSPAVMGTYHLASVTQRPLLNDHDDEIKTKNLLFEFVLAE